MSKPHASNTPHSNEAGDSNLPSTYVDDVWNYVPRSQLNGQSTNTNGAEAPQATAEDSSPSTYVNSLLRPATAAEVERLFEPATPAQVSAMGLDRLTSDSRSQADGENTTTNGTEVPQAASTQRNPDNTDRSTSLEAILEPASPTQVTAMGLDRLTLHSAEPQSIANPIQGNSSPARINGPEFMELYDTDAASRRVTGAVEKETTSTPASSLSGPSSRLAEPRSIANPTQGNTLPAVIIGPDVMQRCNMDAASEHVTGAGEKKSSEETEDTTSTPASDLLGPGRFYTDL